MKETGFQYAVGALRKKRGDLAGEIDQLKLHLRDRRRDLAKVDAVLRLLAPNSDPALIPPKKAMKHLNVFRQGELGALILGILRASGQPMTNLELATAIFERGGFAEHHWTGIRRRCRANLAYLEAQGRVEHCGSGLASQWSAGGCPTLS